MKILYIIHEVGLPVHRPIIDLLQKKGIKVDIELISVPKTNPWADAWARFKTQPFRKKIKSENYDFVISNTHSSYIPGFFNSLFEKGRVLDLEHDIFGAVPEETKHSTVFTFQKKHTEFCVNKNRPFVECRWPLLDVSAPAFPAITADKLKDVVLIGSYFFNDKQPAGFPELTKAFGKIWYKRYRSFDKTISGCTRLPDAFCKPLGTRCCLDSFSFIATSKSSCFVEALLLGCIPILLPAGIKETEEVDDIISNVRIVVSSSFRTLAVTTDNLSKKIELLRKDPTKFEEVRQILLSSWANDNYFTLPSAAEAVYKYVKDFKK